MIDIENINNAKSFIKINAKSKNDIFLNLCSLNLLNAAVKIKEFKNEIHYGLIKPSVSKLINFLIKNSEKNYVEEIYYSSKEYCIYIRCYGIQFSFHNVSMCDCLQDYAKSSQNIEVAWDAIRLQPIALELFGLALYCKLNSVSDKHIITERFCKMNKKTSKEKEKIHVTKSKLSGMADKK